VDNSLRVSSEVLQHGAQRLDDVYEGLQSTLGKARDAQESLRGSWSGGAATTGNAMWADLHDALSNHLEALADNLSKLRIAAGLYRGQDGESAVDIEQQM